MQGPRRMMTGSRRKHQAQAAKARAATHKDEQFFTGADALEEVAKEDGRWNWALVGPDAEKLPLVGGGKGSLDEMHGVLGESAGLFGLLRLTFFNGDKHAIRYVFIQASNMDDAEGSKFSARQRGQVVAMTTKMAAVMKSFINYTCHVEITGQDTCTLAFVMQHVLASSQADEHMLTEENYARAMAEFKEKHPEVSKQEERVEEAEKMAPPPAPEIAVLDVEPTPEEMRRASIARGEVPPKIEEPSPALPVEPPVEVKLRKSVKLFKVGDQVDIFSARNKRWMLDGEVKEVAMETGIKDTIKVKAGAVKVLYGDGKLFKWIPLEDMGTALRVSMRPLPPDECFGPMSKETHGWFVEWHQRYFRCARGFLQWWNTEAEFKLGAVPSKSLWLAGLQLQEEETSFKIRSDATKGMVFNFDAGTPDKCAEWVETIWANAEFCEELREVKTAQEQGQDMRTELMSAMKDGWEKRKSVRRSNKSRSPRPSAQPTA